MEEELEGGGADFLFMMEGKESGVVDLYKGREKWFWWRRFQSKTGN